MPKIRTVDIMILDKPDKSDPDNKKICICARILRLDGKVEHYLSAEARHGESGLRPLNEVMEACIAGLLRKVDSGEILPDNPKG